MQRLGHLCVLVVAASLISCTTVNEIQIEHHQGAISDQKFERATRVASRQATVYRDFETKYAVNASFFSPPFTQAFSQRAASLEVRYPQILDKYKDYVVYFVSIFVPETKLFDLKDENLWTIRLHYGSKQTSPFAIEQIKQKEYWQVFFPYISTWSKEYLIAFPRQFVVDSAPLHDLELVVANAEAKTTLIWKEKS